MANKIEPPHHPHKKKKKSTGVNSSTNLTSVEETNKKNIIVYFISYKAIINQYTLLIRYAPKIGRRRAAFIPSLGQII